MGEETRHSRLFVRLLRTIRPERQEPVRHPVCCWWLQQIVLPVLTAMPSLFCLLVLSGEEVPDLMQKLAAEHPATDPMIKSVSKYHRQEEARHLAFARMLFPEQWAAAGSAGTLIGAPPRPADRRRDVRHDRPPRGLRHASGCPPGIRGRR